MRCVHTKREKKHEISEFEARVFLLKRSGHSKDEHNNNKTNYADAVCRDRLITLVQGRIIVRIDSLN